MAAPAIPYLVGPSDDDAAMTSLPNLVARCNSTDADVYAVITTEAKRILCVRPMVYQYGTTWMYQMVGPSGDLNYQVRHRVTAPPVSGAWAITLFGLATAWMPYNATADEIRAAIEAHPDLNPGDIGVDGSLTDTVNGVLVTIGGNRSRVDYHNGALHGVEDAGQNLRDASGNLLPIHTDDVTHATGDVPRGPDNPDGYGRYGWYAVALRDGEYSGGSRWLKQAARSHHGFFWHAAPPVLTVTRPTVDQSFDGTAPLFRWQVDNVVPSVPLAYQEINYVDNATDESIFVWATASARPTDDAAHITLPRDTSGDVAAREFRLPHFLHQNHGSYRAGFRVINAAGQEDFDLVQYGIEFVPPPPTASFTHTVHPSKAYIDFAWTKTADPNFTAYRITVQAADKPERTIFISEDVEQESCRLLEWPFNRDLIFRHYTEAQDLDVHQVSNPAVIEDHVRFRGTVLSEVVFPRRVMIFPVRRDRRNSPGGDTVFRVPINREKPVGFSGTTFYHRFTVTFPLYDDDTYRTPQQQWDALDGTFFPMMQSGEALLYRDAPGRVLHCRAVNPNTIEDVEFLIHDLTVDFVQIERPGGSL